jgi:hypothetical protein
LKARRFAFSREHSDWALLRKRGRLRAGSIRSFLLGHGPMRGPSLSHNGPKMCHSADATALDAAYAGDTAGRGPGHRETDRAPCPRLRIFSHLGAGYPPAAVYADVGTVYGPPGYAKVSRDVVEPLPRRSGVYARLLSWRS